MSTFTLTLYRVLKSGWQHFIRSWWISLATISVMVLTIFFMTSLILINVIGRTILANLESKVDISLYLKKETKEQDIAKLRSDLLFMNEVKKVTYISAEEAVEKFKEKHKDNPILMESLQELGNPLLPAINIEAQNASQYEAIVQFLEQGKYKDMIEKVNYQETKPLIEKISNFSNKITESGIIISIILSIIAGLVIFNTIRLAMYNFQEEIAVMRLVGASNWFIRGPFLVEGAFYGVVAAIFTIIFLFPFLYIFSPKISSLVPGINTYQWLKDNFFGVFLFQLVVGIALGVISSIVAIRRYLKV